MNKKSQISIDIKNLNYQRLDAISWLIRTELNGYKVLKYFPLDIFFSWGSKDQILLFSDWSCKPTAECYVQPKGLDYRGLKAVTKSGRECQRWDTNSPHKPAHKPS